MKRRGLLGSLLATPIAASFITPERQVGGYAYTIGHPQCIECLRVMWVSKDERLDGTKLISSKPIMECSNNNCSQFGIAYLVPLTPLERA